ncbi:hypothetical protein GWI33_017393 [Rhynchophorus ferrugineus]|uniref:Uncharacterized protein n=1 Tax=Rhynchophorus ferrugineus TaxID=354439 RepID=A0A834IPN0_RHYFE|nr:hypothetical protein GWI33_017393 [Rhynchophorus ferrugineus]
MWAAKFEKIDSKYEDYPKILFCARRFEYLDSEKIHIAPKAHDIYALNPPLERGKNSRITSQSRIFHVLSDWNRRRRHRRDADRRHRHQHPKRTGWTVMEAVTVLLCLVELPVLLGSTKNLDVMECHPSSDGTDTVRTGKTVGRFRGRDRPHGCL